MDGRDGSPSRPIFAAKPPLSSLSFRQERKRPVPPIFDKPGPNGIFEDILNFFLKAFVMAQPVFEKIPLPFKTQRARRPSFPIPDSFGGIRFRWKAENHVDMIGHDGGGVNPPNAGLNSMANGLQKSLGGFLAGKWLQLAVPGTAGDEKYGAIDIDPQRKIVGKRFAACIHVKRIGRIVCAGEIILPETALRA